MLPCFSPTKCPDFGSDFRLEKVGIWTSVPHGNCSCNCEIDVRLLNHQNWTSITQVMVHFPRVPQAALFWPYILSKLWDCSLVRKKGEIGLVSSMEIVDESEKLMFGF